jgi:pilus assembly protein TadC
MTFSLLIALLLTGTAVALGLRAALIPRLDAARQLGRIGAYGFEGVEEEARPRRALSAGFGTVAELIGRAVAGRLTRFNEADVRRELMTAGLYRTTAIRFLGYRVLATVATPALLVWTAASSGSTPSTVVLMGTVGGLCGFVGPKMVVRRLGERRTEQIETALPELIDLLVVMVEAGLGFSRSMQTASGRLKGPLGDEIRLTLQEQRMGLSTTEALNNMLARCNTPSMRSFVRSVVQGESLGVSIGTILRNLATEMRKRRRQAAEERAQKAPIKILFPLIFLIFPSMFIVLLFPALHTFMQSMGGG